MLNITFALLGIVSVVCIPLLWTAWSVTMLFGILGVMTGCVFLIVFLAWMFKAEYMDSGGKISQSFDGTGD